MRCNGAVGYWAPGDLEMSRGEKTLEFQTLVNSINLCIYKSYEQILNLPIFFIDLCYVNVNQTFFG